MKQIFLLSFFCCISCCLSGQTPSLNSFQNNNFSSQLDAIKKDTRISADSTWKLLANWNNFPEIKQTNKYYLFVYKDSVFGDVPVKVFIPQNYKSNVPSPAVLMLHGAVVLSSFKQAYTAHTTSDEDIFYDYFQKKNFIIIRPFADGRGPHADGTKNFDWVVERHTGKANPTFHSLHNIISQLKQIVNIDDNKTFAFGHSDGSDGAFMLEVCKPTAFAGFIAYNSMLTNIRAKNVYLRNSQNRPLYLVHSSLDDLRPIEQARQIAYLFDTINSPILYKEYTGYKHFDKHLQIDLPYSHQWMDGTSRNPFSESLYWETSDYVYNTCDWLRISSFDTLLTRKNWHSSVNTAQYNKLEKKFENELYYPQMKKSGAVRAVYKNNTFYLYTSSVREVELLISPVMVNLEQPVYVYINGKLVFQEKVVFDKIFLLDGFRQNPDRRSLWVSFIKLFCE